MRRVLAFIFVVLIVLCVLGKPSLAVKLDGNKFQFAFSTHIYNPVKPVVSCTKSVQKFLVRKATFFTASSRR